MKSSVAATTLFALISGSVAAPSNLRFAKRDLPSGDCVAPGPDATANAINAWDSDVRTVNAFLEAAPTLGSVDILLSIQTPLTAAEDEPNQLQVLACEPAVFEGTQAQAAADALFDGFDDNVIVPLGNIVASPADATNVAHQLATINQFRCCTVLPSLDILWQTTAANEGLVGSGPIVAPRPSTCAAITC
ncbi:hypothetical protein G647_09563 [Cladophialophora carrionii CBS 160.54]|uniref:Uncharacterized protein n=1 Tax=Cladophialophora carrionii CBS 160.54 TaxID=1279043 RepID=V9DM30_9EURO|nr:uncharacterized protein G647_09563 [Cladophialophora carrionii CBS 160.54]ETI27373.1 hypothetical protein G647_09563 [Cladophialophora carrionii CBS 160.54]